MFRSDKGEGKRRPRSRLSRKPFPRLFGTAILAWDLKTTISCKSFPEEKEKRRLFPKPSNKVKVL